ncbi:MAG: hypothetical protein ACRENP_21095 [Longimicrobiales bacterium]
MAWSNPHEAGGPQPLYHFGGANMSAGYLAFKWGTGANFLTPVGPTDQNVDGVGTSTGKAGYAAYAGALVQVLTRLPGNGGGANFSVQANQVYAVATAGGDAGKVVGNQTGLGSGNVFKCIETTQNSDPSVQIEVPVWYVVWKPRA